MAPAPPRGAGAAREPRARARSRTSSGLSEDADGARGGGGALRRGGSRSPLLVAGGPEALEVRPPPRQLPAAVRPLLPPPPRRGCLDACCPQRRVLGCVALVAAGAALWAWLWCLMPEGGGASGPGSDGARAPWGMLLPTTTTTVTRRHRHVGPPNVTVVPAKPGRWLTCSGPGKCGHKELRPWDTAPRTLATRVEKDFSWLPGIPEDVYEPVREHWESSPPAFGGVPVSLEDLASFTTDLLQSDPFQTGDDAPVLDFNSAREGGVVAISQRQLAFLVANAIMGNHLDRGDGLTELLARCSDSGLRDWIYSLLSFLAVLSRELSPGEQGKLLVAATPQALLEWDEWRDRLQNTLVEPTLCQRVGDSSGCDLADFMEGNPGQALTDIAGGVVGGGARLCSLADSQDESLVQFYPEVLAFSFFVDPKTSADEMGMLPVPWTLLGARRYMGDITGQSMDGQCGRIRDKDWLNQDMMLETVKVAVAGKSAKVYRSAFVAVASVCSSCLSGEDCSETDNLNNLCDTQRRHLDDDLSKWYQAFEPDVYPEEFREAFRQVVKRIGTGPWGAGVWGGDSQHYFLSVWLATSLLSSGALEYYIYPNFCENPGNQCFVLGGDACQQCVADSGVTGVDTERCGSQSAKALVDKFKGQPAQDLYDALIDVGGPPDQVFDAIGRWALDLSGIVRTPLLHLAVRHGPEKLLKPLLPLVSDTDAVDARGLNALVAAAEESRWAAAELLLKAGCSADGRSGYVASEAASRWCNNSAIPEEERETARNLLNTIDECRERPPFRTLAEYFGRQAFGPRGAAGEPGRGRQPELVHGRQPRRFKSQDGQLCLAGGNLRIFARAMVFSKEAEQHEVRFVPLGAAAYGEAVEAEMLDLADRPLLREEALPQCPDELAVPVLLPPQCLRLGADGKERAVTLGLAGEPALELGLPVLAFAPPMGQLRVESCSACCKVAIGRVDVLVDGVRIDATPLVGGMGMPEEDVQSAMEVPVPLKNLKVEAQFSGRQVASERVEVVANADGASRHLQVVSDDPMKAVLEGERSICRCEVGEQCGLLVEVPLAVYVYQQTVDEVEQIDFVYVAGHKADVPDDAETFVGTVEWDGGSKRVDAQAPYVELKGGGCLTLLESMKFKPDLPPGRKFESTEWENTGTCQFWRILGVPRRTGKIENA